MMHNGLDLALLPQVSDSNTSQRAINFKTLDEDALADELEGWHFLQDTVVGGFVEGDSVLGLIFDLSLRPLLFLGCFSTT